MHSCIATGLKSRGRQRPRSWSWQIRRAALAAAILLLGLAPLAEGRVEKATKAARSSGPASVSDNAVLAEVNGETVRVSQLRAWMKKSDFRHARAFLGDNEARKMAFRELVNERLIVQHMRAVGKTNSDEFRGRVRALEVISLGNRVLSEFKKEHVPSGDELRSFLPLSFRDIDLRIFFGATFDETAKAREAVLGGEDMERLVRDSSVGPSAEQGGLIRGYRSKTYIPENIEREAFLSAKGWVSPVFETSLGYSFIRVEEARDLPPDDVARATKGALLLSREDAANRKIEEATRQAEISVDEAKARELDALPASQWRERFGETVARVGGDNVGVEDLYWFISEGSRKALPAPGSGDILGHVNSLARYLAVEKEARARGLDRDPSFTEWLRGKSDQVLYEMYLGEIERSVRVSEKEAKEYFKKNRDAWKKPAGREIREVQAPNRETALSLLDQLRENPEQIGQFAATPAGGGDGGKGVVLFRGLMDPEDEKRVFGAPVGKLTGPFDRGAVWSLIIVDREIPPEDKPAFEDHREEAESAARRENLQKIARKNTDELYKKAAIVTHTKVLDAVGW